MKPLFFNLHEDSRINLSGLSAILFLCCLCVISSTALQAQGSSSFTTVDVPGAGTAAQQGTAILGIDAAGDVAGVWMDSNGLSHGFMRLAAGTFKKFDVVSGGSCVAAAQGTIPTGMDTAGNITGMSRDANGVYHGFVRAASTGTITCFDVKGAGTNKSGGFSQGTKPIGINATSGIVGTYEDSTSNYHSFIRATNGTISTFNEPSASTLQYGSGGTQAVSMNASGEVAGMYTDSNGAEHGFFGYPSSSTYTSFDGPSVGVCNKSNGDPIRPIEVTSIDAAGDVGGSYYDTKCALHGFVRSAATGTITTINVTGAETIPCNSGSGPQLTFCDTFGVRFDAPGDIIGGYSDSNSIIQSFLRPAATGINTSFSDPSAGTGSMQGTLGLSIISTAGEITIAGVYADSNFVLHGFIYTSNLIPTTTTLTPAPTPNPSIYGQPVTLTAKVTSSDGAPPNGENVTFKIGTTSLGTVHLSGGKASLTTTALPTGTDLITAVYHGDADFTGSTSTAVSQKVNQASTTTTLKSSLNPSNYLQSVTFTATVTGKFGGTAGGTVTFKDGTTALKTVSLSGGKAVLATMALAVGTDSITAVYSGDANFAGSTSTAVSQVVNKASTTTTLKPSLNPSSYLQSVTLTATVSGKFGGTASGTVTFRDGPKALKTVSLSGGKAVMTTTALAVGTNATTAVYNGDSNFDGSTSTAVSQKVNKASTTTTLKPSLNPSSYLQSVTLSATVSGQFGGTATGSVTFKDGTTALKTVSLSGGKAVLTTTTLPAGTDSITAVYGGDADFAGSTSTAVSQKVNKATATTTLKSSLNPSSYSQSVTLTATVSGQFGGTATGTVTFKDGTTALKTVSLSGGKAVLATTALALGMHSITAVYNGDANFTGSTSNAVSQVVDETDTLGYTYSIYGFKGSPTDGSIPMKAVIDAQGNVYGITRYGGANSCNSLYGAAYGCGAIVKWDATGKETILHSFTGTDGALSNDGAIVLDGKGNLYGATYGGGNFSCAPSSYGCGTIFKLNLTTNNFSTIHNFTGTPDGANMEGELVLDAQGNLYGTAIGGGANGDGALFKVNASGNYSVIYSFTAAQTDGSPVQLATLDARGNFFGTTKWGGVNGDGSVFKIDPSLTYTTLYSFSGGADGKKPMGLMLDAHGNLWGGSTTAIFKLTLQSNGTYKFSTVQSIAGIGPGNWGDGGVVDAQGNQYGVASTGGDLTCNAPTGCGTVYKIDTSNNTTVLHAFTGTNGDGITPGGLIMDTLGNLYGGTDGGVTTCSAPNSSGVMVVGCGTVFKLALPASIATTTTKLVSSLNPSTKGQSATFTATVAASAGAPPNGETVTFMYGPILVGAGTLSGGKATFTTTLLPAGTDSITAVYSGDSNFSGSASNTVSQVVK